MIKLSGGPKKGPFGITVVRAQQSLKKASYSFNKQPTEELLNSYSTGVYLLFNTSVPGTVLVPGDKAMGWGEERGTKIPASMGHIIKQKMILTT